MKPDRLHSLFRWETVTGFLLIAYFFRLVRIHPDQEAKEVTVVLVENSGKSVTIEKLEVQIIPNHSSDPIIRWTGSIGDLIGQSQLLHFHPTAPKSADAPVRLSTITPTSGSRFQSKLPSGLASTYRQIPSVRVARRQPRYPPVWKLFRRRQVPHHRQPRWVWLTVVQPAISTPCFRYLTAHS